MITSENVSYIWNYFNFMKASWSWSVLETFNCLKPSTLTVVTSWWVYKVTKKSTLVDYIVD